MATHVEAKAVKESINSQAAIALALLSAWEERHHTKSAGPTVEDISSRISILLDENMSIDNLGLRKVPGGVYSEEVETFVGHLLAEGLATHRSPVQLTSHGEDLLRTIIHIESRDHPRAVRRAAKSLKLDTSQLLAGLA